ncbi:hypothetical protein CK203_111255 [Vitis vinifera]|uniref:Uncharacterized protein n=1 Tax=Vitis vinifera TaxID=29760 RepID=A0A438CE71_VITVI|nr:hypothetical protein CK203_111255 [Vitis vinifera]
MRSNFAPPKPFRTLCETQEAHVKMKGHLPILFKPPSRPSPKILISQAPMSLRIPHFPLPPCDLVLLHSISRPLHITSKRRTPRPLRAWTRGLPFIFDMVRTRRAPPAPSLRHTTRQRASLAQMPSDSPSQAMDAPLIPPSKGATTSCPESSVRHPLAKRARTLGPGESSRASEPPTYSKVPSNMSPKTIIKRLMVTAPPIEGNIDYRARPFHSELYFDQEAM